MAHEFSLNTFAEQRLKKVLGRKKLQAQTKQGKVFIVYTGGARSNNAQYIAYKNGRSRGQLKNKRKLGYLLFYPLSKKWGAAEIAIALGREPTYPIRDIQIRQKNGRIDRKLTRKMKTFIGQGRFNNAKSIRGGNQIYRTLLTPLYLQSAELATQFYASERDFKLFDSDFADLNE